MSDAFNTALCRATQLSKPKEEEKTSITIFGMAGGGGLSHIQNSMNIGGQPHRLAYLKPNKASLLKQLGGSGRPVNGIPAYVPDISASYGRDNNPDQHWDYFSPPPEIEHKPVLQQTIVPNISSGTMRSYFKNLTEEEEEDDRLSRKGGGGLSSVQKRIDIGGEPHKLAYINSDEASLLKQLGGSGQNVNGVPAYYFDDQGFSESWSDPGDDSDSSDDHGGWSWDEAPSTVDDTTTIDKSVSDSAPGYASDIPVDPDLLGPGYASLPPPSLQGGASYFGTPLTPEQQETIQEKVDLWARADAAKGKDFVPDDPEAYRDYIKKQEERLRAMEPHHTSKTYWGLSEEEIQAKREAGEFFVNVNEYNVSDYYGPIGQPRDADDPFEIWQDNLAGGYHQAGTVFSSNLPEVPGPDEDWSETEAKLMEKSGAGISSQALGFLDPEAPESWFHAQQLAFQDIEERREKEEEELEKENEMRREVGWLELDEPEGGWKTVDPDKYDDPFMSFIHGIAGFMRRGIPLLGAINFAQRMGGSGEHGMEIQGIEDKIAGGAALASLTGYYGPSLSRETREAEKADEKARLAGTESPSLPEILKKQKRKKDEPEEFKKLGRMKKYFEEKDEKEKKKLLKQFTKDEQKAILDLEKMNQIG